MPPMRLTPTPSAELDVQGRVSSAYSPACDLVFTERRLGLCARSRWRLAIPATDARWDSRIRVPFAPEAPASGIGRTDFFRTCWYRRHCELPEMPPDGRWILHFGAVDWQATVWVNDAFAGGHAGGYTPFSMDVTDLADGSDCEIVVRADDDPHDLAKPRGKQDWQLQPHSIWYPRTTGIWQTVWLEYVPATRIGRLTLTPNLSRWEVGVEVWLDGPRRPGLRLGVKLRRGDTTLAADTYDVVSGEVHRGIALSDPGIDDSRNELLWSPRVAEPARR